MRGLATPSAGESRVTSLPRIRRSPALTVATQTDPSGPGSIARTSGTGGGRGNGRTFPSRSVQRPPVFVPTQSVPSGAG